MTGHVYERQFDGRLPVKFKGVRTKEGGNM